MVAEGPARGFVDQQRRALRCSQQLGGLFDQRWIACRNGLGAIALGPVNGIPVNPTEVAVTEDGLVTRELFAYSPSGGFKKISEPEFLDRLEP